MLSRFVTGLTLITAARVPLIKFKYGALDVDVVFGSVALLSPPTAEQMRQDEFLLTVSADNRFNVNGIRTVLEIRQRVPVPYECYVAALKAVKRWAMRRGVYGNLFTYPNGAALAIMMARVCLLYSKSRSATELLRYFFSVYTFWLTKAGQVTPVFITESIRPKPVHIPGMSACWDQSRESCRDELLPVLNPAYPYVNSAHSLGRAGFSHFLAELTRAHALLSDGKRGPLDAALAGLWTPYRTTDDYSHFVAVHVACVARTEAHLAETFGIWRGLVESRLRMFIYALESFMDVRPVPEAFLRCEGRSLQPERRSGNAATQRLMENVFFFGVRTVRDGVCYTPDPEVVQTCFAELQFSLKESTVGTGQGSNSFKYDRAAMKDPWFTLHHIEDTDFPAELSAQTSA